MIDIIADFPLALSPEMTFTKSPLNGITRISISGFLGHSITLLILKSMLKRYIEV